MNQKLGCDDDRREKTRCRIKHPQPRLFSHVGDVAEIPSDEIVYLVKRGDRDMYGIGYVFAVKDAPIDIAFGEYRNFLGKVELLKGLDEVETA